jgi:hypothetical protein
MENQTELKPIARVLWWKATQDLVIALQKMGYTVMFVSEMEGNEAPHELHKS